MQRVSLPLMLRWAVLTGYALLVALGHGGWHVVVDHGSCMAHGSHAGHADPGQGTFTCSHGHVHSHAAPGHHSPEHEAPSPTHDDSDHCPVCAVFSAPLTVAVVVEVAWTAVEMNYHEEFQTLFVPATPEWLYAPRGPPVG